MQTLTREQCRLVDRRAIEHYGLPGVVLMENAGRGIVDGIERVGLRGPTLICCGKGNNAGDGFVIARHLALRGHAVRVLVWAERVELTGDAQTNFLAIEKLGLPIDTFGSTANIETLRAAARDAHLIVDALLGTGAHGAPRPPMGSVIDALNSAARPITAVDLPSGLDCDRGEPAHSTIRATHTFTLLAVKPGLLAATARPFVGELHVCDIGVPQRVIDEVLQASA